LGAKGGSGGSYEYEVDEVGGGSGGCPYESPMYESPIHKRTPRAGSIAVESCLEEVEKRVGSCGSSWKLFGIYIPLAHMNYSEELS
jgi:hypothetical protein